MPNEDTLVASDIHIQATYRLTEALVAAEKKMRRRVQLLSEVVFETDSQGNLLFLNNAWRNTLGYQPEACLSQPLRSYVMEEDRSRFDLSLSSESPVQARFLGVNGDIVWMECTATTLDEGGHVGALRDITRQKQTQDEVSKLSLVASSTDNMVIITDRHGLIEWVNHAFTRRTGYVIDEVRGLKPGSFLQGPETDPQTVALIRDYIARGVSFSCDLLNYSKSREPYWASINVTPIRDSAGNIERFISVQSDSTNLRRTQQQLKTAKEAAEAANVAKTNFLATISHEMRTPLNVILGSTELALESVSAEDRVQHLRRINESGETLLRLISDLLDISKIEDGQVDLERVPFDLRTCLRGALEPVALAARGKGLDFRILCDERLPEMVLGDPGRLRQILVNLAENAVKFTSAGFVRVDAAFANAGSGPILELRVADSGIGIPEESHARIFERFVQVDNSTTRTRGGAGLGLSIVRFLAEALGGAVAVQSAPGRGSEFVVKLPLVVPSAAPAPEVGKASESTLPAVCRLLVAEDNDANFAIIERHLTNAGYRVDRAANGRLAVEAARQVRYHLVLMDVEMPEMDGLTATAGIREEEALRNLPPVPIVALTAHAVQGYRERCLAAGCSGYLAKPVRKPMLLETVAALVKPGGGGEGELCCAAPS